MSAVDVFGLVYFFSGFLDSFAHFITLPSLQQKLWKDQGSELLMTSWGLPSPYHPPQLGLWQGSCPATLCHHQQVSFLVTLTLNPCDAQMGDQHQSCSGAGKMGPMICVTLLIFRVPMDQSHLGGFQMLTFGFFNYCSSRKWHSNVQTVPLECLSTLYKFLQGPVQMLSPPPGSLRCLFKQNWTSPVWTAALSISVPLTLQCICFAFPGLTLFSATGRAQTAYILGPHPQLLASRCHSNIDWYV